MINGLIGWSWVECAKRLMNQEEKIEKGLNAFWVTVGALWSDCISANWIPFHHIVSC